VGLGFKPINEWLKEMSNIGLISFLENKNIECFFIRGNHDNPSWFDDKTVTTKSLKAVSDYSILSAPNRNILCVGGGISLDRTLRKKYHNDVQVLLNKKTFLLEKQWKTFVYIGQMKNRYIIKKPWRHFLVKLM